MKRSSTRWHDGDLKFIKNGPSDLRDLEEKVFSNVTLAENVHFKKKLLGNHLFSYILVISDRQVSFNFPRQNVDFCVSTESKNTIISSYRGTKKINYG